MAGVAGESRRLGLEGDQEVSRACDRVDPGLGLGTVGRTSPHMRVDPEEALVGGHDRQAGGLADDRGIGAHPARDQRFHPREACSSSAVRATINSPGTSSEASRAAVDRMQATPAFMSAAPRP